MDDAEGGAMEEAAEGAMVRGWGGGCVGACGDGPCGDGVCEVGVCGVGVCGVGVWGNGVCGGP
jgi:hypothetical protein